jgi:hypothetical protein
MRMINPPLILAELKIFSFIFSRVGVPCFTLKYDRRAFTFGQIGVGIGMCDRTERYINASCPFDISETSCPSHVRSARQVNFHVFRPEKRIPAGKAFLSVCCASAATTSILFIGKCGKVRNRCSTP